MALGGAVAGKLGAAGGWGLGRRWAVRSWGGTGAVGSLGDNGVGSAT